MEHNVDKEKMDSLKALADTNMQISTAKGTLVKLQEMETDYLVEREKKAVARVAKIFADSAELLEKATSNYAEVHDLCQTASSFADYLVKSYDSFSEVVRLFDEKSALWDESVKAQEAKFAEINRQIKTDRVLLENDKESLKKREGVLKQGERKLADDRASLERAINRLKEGKI